MIGKRVADAVRAQPDMQLVGVCDVATDYRIKTAVVLGVPVYASGSEKAAEMRGAGIPVAGTLDDLLKTIDVAVDCTPKGVGAKNLGLLVWAVARSAAPPAASRGEDSPEAILKRRYARGDVDREEYERRLTDLGK